MPIVAGNGTIEGGSSSFTVKNSSSNAIFKRGISNYSGNNFAYYENAGVPAFITGSSTDPGWVAYGSGSWHKLSNYCNVTSYNRGSHYSTTNTRFTAPIRGPYWFSYTCYIYSGGYVHPIFSVNGNLTSNYGQTQYRMRGHGMLVNYQQDVQIEEVIFLNVGDYVEPYWYSSGTSYQYVRYCLFQGAFVG